MGSRFGVVYSVVTVLFFVAIGVIFVLRMNAARDENVAAASENLQVIRKTAQLAFGDSSIPRDRFRGAMNGIEEHSPSLLVVAVYSYTGGTEYMWARDNSFLKGQAASTSTSAGIPEFQFNELTATRISDSFDTSTSATYFVTAVYSVLSNGDVFPLLRDSLVLVLLFALGTLIITVLLMVTSRRGADAAAESAGPTPAGENPAATEGDRVVVTDAPYDVAGSTVAARDLSEPRTDDAGRAAEPAESEAASTGSPTAETSHSGHSPERARSATSTPSASHGPATARGGSAAHGLERRLTLELERAAYNDQNLSVLVIRVPGIDERPDAYRALSKLIVSHYSFEDLVFEIEKDSFCVILVNTELAGAIRTTEVFQERLPSAVNLPAKSEPSYGLSSRNGRLIEARQLLKEATTALRRAAGTTGVRIVGFHSDPEKYREFIAGKPR